MSSKLIFSASLCIFLISLSTTASSFDLGKEIRNAGRTIDEKVTRPFVADPLTDLKEETIEAVTGTDKDDLIRDTRAQYAASRREMQTAIATVEAQFETALGDLDDSIADIKYMGIDPRRVRSDDGSFVDMIKVREDMVAQRDASLRELNQNLASLSQEEADAIRKIERTYR